MSKKSKKRHQKIQVVSKLQGPQKRSDTEPDWSGKCEVCGATPIVPATGMCGPCSFGEADTAGGNW